MYVCRCRSPLSFLAASPSLGVASWRHLYLPCRSYVHAGDAEREGFAIAGGGVQHEPFHRRGRSGDAGSAAGERAIHSAVVSLTVPRAVVAVIAFLSLVLVV